MNEEKNDIEKILEERLKLDSILQSKFSKQITIMFTDIKGSTSYYEARGDIDGRVMVHRHNEIVLPAIKDNGGTVLKTIGDAIMSVYDEPHAGVKAAIDIQQRLYKYNRGRQEKEQIHVRVGLNYGTGLVEKNDVYGDVVNVASRVESLAGADEILVTDDLYRKVKNSDDFIFRYAETTGVKGKKEPLKVYRVVWHEETISIGKTRRADEAVSENDGMFVIEASLSGEMLKVSGFDKIEGEERTVKSYEEIKYNEADIKTYTKGIVDLLNRANRRGKIGNDLLVKLQEYGRLLYDDLIPLKIREKLANTVKKYLMISIDDRLVHIPWELLFDGEEFICQRFNVGRTVSTRQNVAVARRIVSRPVKMQILADPRGDLLGSYREGVTIKDEIGVFEDFIDVTTKTTDIKTDYVKAKIRNFDIVHYAGHAEHNALHPEESGWMLKDGKLSAQHIMNMSGVMPMPSLVFSNACQTGQTDEWKLEENYEDKIFGLANAFLLSGVQHYIGTFWEIPDEAASYFALHFYKNLFHGSAIGEAMRHARSALVDRYGKDVIIWSSYMLYGDPTIKYIGTHTVAAEGKPGPAPEMETLVSSELRHPEELIQFPSQKKSYLMPALAGAALIAAAVFALLFMMRKGTDEKLTDTNIVRKEAPAVAKEDEGKRIDELVASLAKEYRDDKKVNPSTPSDEWTTRPMTIVFMDITSTGNAAAGDKEKLIGLLTMSLQNGQRVNIVERDLLMKLLEELKLSASALADPATSLKIGKVLSAQLIVTGSIISDKTEQTTILRFIDTETTAVKKVISSSSKTGGMDSEFIKELSRQISGWINEEIPVRGRIVTATNDKCRLNLGQMHGLHKGDRFEVLEEVPAGSGLYEAKGEIQISDMEKDKSWGIITKKTDSIREGGKVKWKI